VQDFSFFSPQASFASLARLFPWFLFAFCLPSAGCTVNFRRTVWVARVVLLLNPLKVPVVRSVGAQIFAVSLVRVYVGEVFKKTGYLENLYTDECVVGC